MSPWRLRRRGSLGRRFQLITLLNGLLLVSVVVAVAWLDRTLRSDLTRATRAFAEEQRMADRLTESVLRQVVLAAAPLGQEVAEARGEFEAEGSEVQAVIRRYLFRDLDPEARFQLEMVKEYHQKLEVRANQAFGLYSRGRPDEAQPFTEAALLQAQELQSGVSAFMRMREGELARLQEQQARLLNIVMIGAGVVIAFYLASFLLLGRIVRRRIADPLAELTEAAERIGEGDLAARVRTAHDEEFAILARAFNRMALRLEEARTELVRSEKLSAVGRMMAGLAHELNNPLAAVLGYAELLEDRLKSDGDIPPEELRELIEPILTQGARARGLIMNLLRFSRGGSPETGPVFLPDVLDVVVGVTAHTYEREGLGLVVEEVPRVWVVAEEHRLQQVLVNIIDNARDAMSEEGGGELRIRIRMEGEETVVTLEDEGPGLKDPEKVFDPFYTTKASDEGTGLGLALVHQFMEEFGGAVEAENVPGGGARFVLRFRTGEVPEVEAVTPEPTAPRREPSTPRPPRILIVEDEPALLKLQERMLRRLDAEVVRATRTDEARRKLGDHEVDAVVSDHRMPGESGMELYRWIRDERPELVGRFIFVTGDVADPAMVEFAEKHPHRIISKPFEYGEYLEAVRKVLE